MRFFGSRTRPSAGLCWSYYLCWTLYPPLHRANTYYYIHSISKLVVHRPSNGPGSPLNARSLVHGAAGNRRRQFNRRLVDPLPPGPLKLPLRRALRILSLRACGPPCPPRPRSQPPIFVRSALAPSALESWASSGTQNSWARGNPSRPLPLVI